MAAKEERIVTPTTNPIVTPRSTEEERRFALDFYIKKRKLCKSNFTRAHNQVVTVFADTWSQEVAEKATLLIGTLHEKLKALRAAHDSVLLCGTEEEANLEYTNDAESQFDFASMEFAKRDAMTLHRKGGKSTARGDTGSDDDEDSPRMKNESRYTPFQAGKEDPYTDLSEEDKKFFALMSFNYDVRKEVPKFDGTNLLQYNTFRQAWETADKNLSKMGKSPAEKLMELKKVLSGKALKYIGSLTDSHGRNYQGAINMLDRYYYDNQSTATAVIKNLMELPRMSNDTQSIESVYFELAQARQILDGLDLSSEQSRTLLFTSLCEVKLNTFITKSWAKKCETKKDAMHPLGHTATEDDLFEVIEREIKMSRTMTFKKNDVQSRKPDNFHNQKKTQEKTLPGSFSTQEGQDKKEEPCKICDKKGHKSFECFRIIKEKNVKERWNIIKEKKLCWLCLSKHKANQCKGKPCPIDGCGKKHHSLLHERKQPQVNSNQVANQTKRSETEKDIPTSNSVRNKTVEGTQRPILQACMAWAVNPSNERFKVRVFLDSGSEISLIRRELAENMGLDGRSVTLQMQVAGGLVTNPSKEKIVSFYLESLDNTYTTPKLEATTVKNISKDLREIPISTHNYGHLKGIKFTEEFPRKASTVDVMIGVHHYNMLVNGTPIRGKPQEPMALPTKLGYVLTGSFIDKLPQSNVVVYTSMRCSVEHDALEKFWDLESIGITKEVDTELSHEDKQALDMMDKSTYYVPEEKTWYTSLLFKKDPSSLEKNKSKAAAILMQVEKSAIKNQKVDEINKSYQEMIDGGFSEEVKEMEEPMQGKVHFLSCHPVYREEKSTTKCRIVTNASAKGRNGLSLNDHLFKGPCLLPDFVQVFLRFCTKYHAFVMDISKMFLRVKLHKDQDFLRFLWRNCDTMQEIKSFRMNAVTFGVISSPFQAIYVIKKHAENMEKTFPLAKPSIDKNTYMDDVSDGANTTTDAKKLLNQLVELLMEASMTPHKLASNKAEVLEGISPEFRSPERIVKVLGIPWDTKDDFLTFDFSNTVVQNEKDTKRQFLKQSASIFDPLGLVSPLTSCVKMLFQSVWLDNIDWNEELPEETQKEWQRLKNEIRQITHLSTPRCYFDTSKSQPVRVELFAFGDASNKSYATAIYLKGTYDDGTSSSRLIFAKSRVSPIKMMKDNQPKSGRKIYQPETIVRLELLGALITARAVDYVLKAFHNTIKIDQVYCFTDSMINLCRIRAGPDKFKVWVGNRVAEIVTLTDKKSWKHCPGTINPADLATRGLTAQELKDSELWWKGPSFILKNISEWPKEQSHNYDPDPERMLDKGLIDEPMMAMCQTGIDLVTKLIQRFECWYKTVKMIAMILRLGYIPHKKYKKCEYTVLEKKDTELFLWKLSQSLGFPKEIKQLQDKKQLDDKSKIIQYNPVWDSSRNIIISDSRLTHSILPEDTKRPILLPKNCAIVSKYVLYLHVLHGHAGPGYLLSLLRQKFQLIQGRSQVRKIVRTCTTKRCSKPRPLKQQMSPLPSLRTDNPSPFTAVAVDLFGPMMVKHNCQMEQCPHLPESKVYGALFTCFHSRAVHLELIKEQSTEEFLYALRSFVARRGTPNVIFSDNAKNFKGASKEIRCLYKSIKWQKVQTEGKKLDIEWIFNVEKAPWANGIAERMVRSVKTPLRVILGSAKLTFRQLSLILTEIEAMVNNRPLANVNDHPDDITPITASELINGRRLNQLPDPNIQQNQTKMVKYWRKRQLLLNSFWKRWYNDYLIQQNVRKKWHKPSTEDLMGKFVLIRDDNMARNDWKMGKIIETILSKDGLIRTVIVKTPTSTLRRPIQKLALLENIF